MRFCVRFEAKRATLKGTGVRHPAHGETVGLAEDVGDLIEGEDVGMLPGSLRCVARRAETARGEKAGPLRSDDNVREL